MLTIRAVWTRFHPIAYAVQEVIHSGKLGKVKRFSADFSMDFNPDKSALPSLSILLLHLADVNSDFPDDHRMVDPKLGGGALLDMFVHLLPLRVHPAKEPGALTPLYGLC